MWMSFRKDQEAIVSQLAGVFYLIGLVLGCGGIATFLLRCSELMKEMTIWFVMSMVILFASVFINKFHTKHFIQWYNWIAVTSELVLISLKACLTEYEDPGSDGISQILVMWSPLVALLILGILFHTTFWAQVLGQFTSTIASHYWIYSLCRNQHLAFSLSKLSNGLLWHLDSCISTMFLVQFRCSGGGYPCGISTGFLHFNVGFVIPCIIKYVLESRKRAKYLSARFPCNTHNVVRRLFWGNVQAALGVSVFFFMGSWALVHKFTPLDHLGQCSAAVW